MSDGFTIIEGLLIIIVILLLSFGGYYIMNSRVTNQGQTNSTRSADGNSEGEIQKFNSELYPDLSFDVPEGWSVNEPSTYNTESFNFDGSVDSIIEVSNERVTLNLEFKTVIATGFEGYTCHNHPNLAAVGEHYRFEDSNGDIVYQPGVSESDESWQEASSGEFSYSEDADPNYCGNFPFIGTYSSTIYQSDYPDTPYGYVEHEKALAWLGANLKGEVDSQVIEEADSIIISLSEPVVN